MHQKVTNQYISETRFLFHSHCKIKIPIKFGTDILDDCFQEMENIDRKYNSYQKGSSFNNLNRSAGRWVETDEVTLSILEKLFSVSEATDGAYDVSSMPLLRLWGFYKEQLQEIPKYSEIKKTLENVNYKKINVSGGLAKISEGQELITGSFIKAFAVDNVIKKLRDYDISDAIVNAGGSTIYGLNNDLHPHWKINIPSPYEQNGYIEQKLISNSCFSLSGRLNSSLEIKGKKYGHILNAKTGYPSETLQVGVFTDSAFWSDVISTALFAVQPEKFEKTVKALLKLYAFEYYVVTPNNKLL